MTRARNGAAQAAPTRAVRWYVIPDDDDRGPSKTFPRCADGDELLARTESGEVVEVTVEHRHGVRFVGLDGEHVEAAAIAERPRASRHGTTQSEAAREAAGKIQLKVRISAAERRMLQWIQDQDGHDLSTIIGTYIRTEYDERAAERR